MEMDRSTSFGVGGKRIHSWQKQERFKGRRRWARGFPAREKPGGKDRGVLLDSAARCGARRSAPEMAEELTPMLRQYRAMKQELDGDALLLRCARYTLNQLVPKVENRFERITLVNLEKTERLTIDTHVKFHHWETGHDNTFDRLVIIELKRDGNVPSPVLDILHQLRIHPSGFSKYCIGTVLTNDGIKQNMFRPKVRKIEKMLSLE